MLRAGALVILPLLAALGRAFSSGLPFFIDAGMSNSDITVKLRPISSDPTALCPKNRLPPDQYEMCRYHSGVMQAFLKGSALGLRQCQYLFGPRRWNCTTADRSSFETVLSKATRETAFVHAVTVAGLVYSISRKCALGDLRECGCDRSWIRDAKRYGDWLWGGCGDNVEYGVQFSRNLILARTPDSDRARDEMDRHNVIAGGQIAQDSSKMECQCHGFSGTCTVKTCWKQLPLLHTIGLAVKHEFDGAVKVALNVSGDGLVPENSLHLPPTASNLVYLKRSSDYCSHDPESGSHGTTGRECNVSSDGVDGCALMCCNRGHYAREVVVTSQCLCRFVWCCHVECKTCSKRVIKHFCN